MLSKLVQVFGLDCVNFRQTRGGEEQGIVVLDCGTGGGFQRQIGERRRNGTHIMAVPESTRLS